MNNAASTLHAFLLREQDAEFQCAHFGSVRHGLNSATQEQNETNFFIHKPQETVLTKFHSRTGFALETRKKSRTKTSP